MCRGVTHTLWANTGSHYVVSIPGKRSAMYYDDAVALVVLDFDLAADRLLMMHGKSTEMISQMISDGFAAPFADLGQAPTGRMEMLNEGVRDEGVMGGVPALTMGGGPGIAISERRGKRDAGVLDLSECPKPVAGRPETCSTPGT